MSLLAKVQTLLHKWFPNKEDDWANYNTWSNSLTTYSNGKLDVAEDYDEIAVTTSHDIDMFTIYAQLKKNGNNANVQGIPLTFKKNGTTLATYTTDSSGNKSYPFPNTHIGEMEITVTDGVITSKPYVVEDIIFYDECASDSSSQYTKVNSATLSWHNYVGDGKCYAASNNGSNTFECIVLPITNCPTNLAVEADIMVLNSGSNIQPRFGFATNNSSGYYVGINYTGNVIRRYDGTDLSLPGNYSSSIGLGSKFYHYKVTYKNNIFTANIYDGSTLLSTSSMKINFTPTGIAFGMVANNVQLRFKNLVVKRL